MPDTGTDFAEYLAFRDINPEIFVEPIIMRAHAEKISERSLFEIQPSFSKEQVAFLEDLLINKGCMRALVKGQISPLPEKCRECAVNFADIVDTIRDMKKR